MSELSSEQRCATPFRHADGSTAYVFSSQRRDTVLRHFRWMQEYGIDGAFVHRFPVEIRQPAGFKQFNQVLAHCRAGASQYGRVWALRYELCCNLDAGDLRRVVMADWKFLVDELRIREDPAYLRHDGRPVVYVWGIGINDGRKYGLDECAELIEFLKHDPRYGGNYVIAGAPNNWRTLDGDAVRDPKLIEVLSAADMINPWTPGRYATTEQATRQAERVWKPDVDWCRAHHLGYAPTVFPGFSWHNMFPDSPSPLIPRQRGRFLWAQFCGARAAGADTVYVAMFDELNEGTAILKCTDAPPTGASKFVDMEGLPSDHYLWLTGQGARLVRGELQPATDPPPRAGSSR